MVYSQRCVYPSSTPLSILIFHSGLSLLDDNIDGREIYPRSDSEGCFELANSWLQDCVRDHPICSSYSQKGVQKLPFRVLDLGPSDGSQEPYLLETEGRTGLYATLSHCWGRSPGPTTTETHTLAQRKKEIPIDGLPKSFRDAIIITRRLNVRYLWIDSLCILQDSVQDWNEQSKLMAQVYGNSHICISALLAPNSHHGIFHTRDLAPSVAISFPSPTSSTNESFTLNLRSPLFKVDFPTYTNIKDTNFSGPLDERAWALQERIMSPRVLRYSSIQMVWECECATFCEGRASQLPVLHSDIPRRNLTSTNDLNYKSWRRWTPSTTTTPAKDVEAHGKGEVANHVPHAEVYENWYMIVENYRRKSLTFPSDTLPALSALASFFASATHTTTQTSYLAGLWLEDLPSGLLWIPVDMASPNGTGRASTYRAPSWSWSSTNAIFVWQRPKIGTRQSLIKVIAVERIWKTVQDEDPASDGEEEETEGERENKENETGKEVEIFSLTLSGPFQLVQDSVLVSDEGSEPKLGMRYMNSQKPLRGEIDFRASTFKTPIPSEDPDEEPRDPQLAVLLLRKAIVMGWVESELLTHGLILMEAVNDVGMRGWMRIGTVTVYDEIEMEGVGEGGGEWETKEVVLI